MRCKSAAAPATVNGRKLVHTTGGYSGKVSVPGDVKPGDLLIHFAITFGGKVRSSCYINFPAPKRFFPFLAAGVGFIPFFCGSYDEFYRQWIGSLPFFVVQIYLL